MIDPTNILTPIAERLRFLDNFCDDLIQRVRTNNEHEARIGEIRNIQTSVRAAWYEIKTDPAYTEEAIGVFIDSKKRLTKLESDPEYLGLHAHVK